jgi:hypothetical protein
MEKKKEVFFFFSGVAFAVNVAKSGTRGKKRKRNHKYPHLSFLTLITDMMTSRLPKMAAMIINIIMNAEKTVIKTLIHS